MNNNEKTTLCKTKPEDFIERYCSKLNINKELTKCSIFVAMRIQNNNIIPENTPHSIAAGIVQAHGGEVQVDSETGQRNNIHGFTA